MPKIKYIKDGLQLEHGESESIPYALLLINQNKIPQTPYISIIITFDHAYIGLLIRWEEDMKTRIMVGETWII